VEDKLFKILRDSKVIVVVGASINPEKVSSKITKYLMAKKYKVYPVNPAYIGKKIGGIDFLSSVAEVDEPVDIVDIFRRSEHLVDLEQDILHIRPKVVWLQLEIREEGFEKRLRDAGIEVVVDHCIHKVREKMDGK